MSVQICRDSYTYVCISVSIYVYTCVLVVQSCPTLGDPVDCGLPDSSVHGILQARILEQAAISFFRGSSQPRDQTWVSWHFRQILYCLSHQGSFGGGINPVKSQKVNILGSQGPTVSTVTTQLCHCR